MKKTLLLTCFLFAISIYTYSQHAINAIDVGAIDYVEVPDNTNGSLDIGDGFTVEAWILTGSAQSNQKVAGKIAGDFANGFILGIQDGEVNMEVFDVNGMQTVLQTGTVPDTTWTHIAGTYEEGGMLTIYVNGQNVGSVAASTADHSFNENPFRIGIAPWDINALGFFGYIDEVRYFNAILDENTIRDWMHKDLDADHPGFTNLGLYHKYDEGVDITADDLSENANDGTLIGALWIPSTVPFKGTYDLFENEVRGVWLGQNEATSDILTLTGNGITGDQSVVFANSADDYSFFGDAPGDYDKSLAKVWRVTAQGLIPPSIEASFDLSPIDLTNVSNIALLFNDELNFDNATAIEGTISGNTLTVPAEFFLDGYYYTLGFDEGAVSNKDIYSSELDFEITPNPNNGQFQIFLESADTEQMQFKLTDLTGKLLFEKTIYPLQQQYTEAFDFSYLSKGAYLLQLSDGTQVSTRKIIF